MSKKKPAANKKGNKATTEDDDWEAILQAERAVNTVATPQPPVAAPVAPPAPPAKAEDDDSDDDGDDADPKKKDKRRKKKKGGKEKEEVKAGGNAPMSAQAKAILLHKQKIADEEARLKKLQEEEEERVRLENERIEAEIRAKEEEKERRRKAKQEKVEAQKAAGTYMTKTEKERYKKAQARLETLKAAGMVVVPVGAAAPATAIEESGAKPAGALLYGRKKKAGAAKSASTTTNTGGKEDKDSDNENSDEESDEDSDDEDEEEPSSPAPVAAVAVSAPTAAAVEIEVADDWDADDDFDVDLSSKLVQVVSLNNDGEEDLTVADKRAEQEKLKQLGLERQRRAEEERARREEEDRMREEMEQRELEAKMKKEQARKARLQREEDARKARSPDNLRSAISCIMGHVDTGKTKLLDKIRHTNVQEGEAGGITQQIGATQFSRETLEVQTQCMQEISPFEIKLPGLLVIDTPGHESFTNLRSRGSSLCDIAILVIDLMHGLEPQTIESINLLKKRRTPFVVALNKVDRCYGWKTMKDAPIQKALAAQDENVHYEFRDRTQHVITQLMEQGLNSKLYWDNNDLGHTVSLVPTSAISGEGVPDLLRMLITLTQERMVEQLMYMELLQCTVLEVKVIEGLGHTVDVVLVNGTLKEGDTIVVSTMDGPVVTNIRALLTPPPNREMRVKSEYVHHSVISGATGVKIVAPDIGRAVAGTPLIVVSSDDDVEDIKEEVQSDLNKVMKSLQTDNQGVMVNASTLGALEALLQFLREECKPPIPVSYVNIGPIHKKDVMRASIMHEKKLPEYATILAFNVPIDHEAREFAEESKVRIFTAEIIYHLFDQFTAYMNGLREAKKQEASQVVVFPCVLKILPRFIFNKKDPIVIGVEVVEGTLRLNTPICIPSLSLDVGRITRLEINHKEVTVAKKGVEVAIRITNESNPTITYGRQFDDKNALYSKISRASIDACKEYYKEEMSEDDWRLIIKLKKVFNI